LLKERGKLLDFRTRLVGEQESLSLPTGRGKPHDSSNWLGRIQESISLLMGRSILLGSENRDQSVCRDGWQAGNRVVDPIKSKSLEEPRYERGVLHTMFFS